jgi:uncharacterized protein YnzC (UPF0291/DUF896 family)
MHNYVLINVISTYENYDFPLPEWIKLIKNLPDYILENDHGIRIPFRQKNEVEFLMYRIRAKYRAIANWLQFYLLDDQGIQVDLKFSTKSHYKPVAEISVARYNLAQELQFHLPALISPFDENNNPFNPGRWMTFCLYEDCKNDLKSSGLLDRPRTEGKSAQYLRVQKNLKWLEEAAINRVELVTVTSEPTIKNVNATSFLEICSVRIAQINERFQEDYHNKYIKTLRSCHRKIRNDPFFKVTVLDEKGDLVTKRKSKGKSKKTGFA